MQKRVTKKNNKTIVKDRYFRFQKTDIPDFKLECAKTLENLKPFWSMRSGRITKRGAPSSPWLSKDERLRIMGIGNLILGINSVTVPYLIHYDRYYYKM